MFHFPLRHFGVFCLLVLAYLGVSSFVSRQIRLDGLDYAHPTELFSEASGPAAAQNGPLDNQAVLNSWRSQFSPAKKPVLVVMAIKGGGVRSAAWTTLVLSRLEQGLPALPHHTRLISGVSGGMLGATYYVATLNAPTSPDLHATHSIPRKKHFDVYDLVEKPELADTLVDQISQDSLSPLARHLALPLRGDRGEALEQAWEKNTHGVLARPFSELRDAEQAGWCPSLVFSPMLVEDGRRLVISNLDLGFLVHNDVRLLMERAESPGQPAPRSLSGWQLSELFPYATSMRLSTIARMNASFPYITPEAELPTTPPRRVVDAAYYDGYGVNLAALWIYHEREWIRDNTSGIVLLQIRDRPHEQKRPAYWPRWHRALARFTTPLEAAWHAREASMSFRNDELLAWLNSEFNRTEDPDFFTTVVFESPVRAPLSWYLPPEDLRMLKDAIQTEDSALAKRLDLLKHWWTRREAK